MPAPASPVRTLLLTSRAPWPPIGGDRLRTFQLARALSDAGPVHVVCIDDPTRADAVHRGLPFAERVDVMPMRKVGAGLRVARAALSPTPLQQALYATPAVQSAVRAACETVDVVVAHLLRTVPWLPPAHPPLVLCLQDALAAQAREAADAPGFAGGWRRVAMAAERARLGRAEADAARRAHAITAITQRDRQLLIAAGLPGDRISVVPACVDPIPTAYSPPEPDTALFFGNLRTASNQDMAIWLATRIWPMVRTQVRSARLRICGIEAPPRVRRLGSRAGVDFVGSVESMADEVSRAWLTVCPLRFGSGVQNKVLESLASGTPAVVTPRVLDTLHPDAQSAVRVGSHERALAVAIIELLRDRSARDRLGEAGVAYTRAHHGPEVFAPLMDAVRTATTLARAR